MDPTDAKFWVECEICAKRNLLAFDALDVSDALIAKALEVSELARMARVETMMRELLYRQWLLRSEQAAVRAGAIMASTGNITAALAGVDALMAKWSGDVEVRYGNAIEDTYKLARQAAYKKATGQTKGSLRYTTANFTDVLATQKNKASTAVAFDIYDESAIAALQKDQMFWIGDHYQKNVRDTLAKESRAAVERGLGRRAAGQRLEDEVRSQLAKVSVPGGFRGNPSKYFEGLAANTATNARVRGQLRSFSSVGVTRYVCVNPGDERTSQICQHMNGKTFLVEQAITQVESEAGATNPNDVRRAHPWMSFDALRSISPKAGSAGLADMDALAKSGQALPPYHFRCRTTIDIDGTSFDTLTTSERKIIAEAPKTKRKPPTSVRRSKPTAKPKATTPQKEASTFPPKPKLKDSRRVLASATDAEKNLQKAILEAMPDKLSAREAEKLILRTGANVPVELAKEFPKLVQALGGRLDIAKDAWKDPRVQNQVRQLAKFPPGKMFDVVHSKGQEFKGAYIGTKPLPELDQLGNLKGVQPRGWPPGKTWDDCGGAGGVDVAVSAVNGSSGSASTILHEFGHTVGGRLGLDDDPALINFHKQLFASQPSYMQQGGPGAFAGRQEMLAESVAHLFEYSERLFNKVYSAEYRQWLAKTLEVGL